MFPGLIILQTEVLNIREVLKTLLEIPLAVVGNFETVFQDSINLISLGEAFPDTPDWDKLPSYVSKYTFCLLFVTFTGMI